MVYWPSSLFFFDLGIPLRKLELCCGLYNLLGRRRWLIGGVSPRRLLVLGSSTPGRHGVRARKRWPRLPFRTLRGGKQTPLMPWNRAIHSVKWAISATNRCQVLAGHTQIGILHRYPGRRPGLMEEICATFFWLLVC